MPRVSKKCRGYEHLNFRVSSLMKTVPDSDDRLFKRHDELAGSVCVRAFYLAQ